MSTKVLFLAASAATLVAFGANAATVTVSAADGNESVSKNGLSENTSITGVSLVGSVITANYQDGSSEQMTWEQTGRYIGGVAGAFITMSFERSDFLLTTAKTLTSLVFDAGSGGALFDLNQKGTVGSKYGFTYTEVDPSILDGLIDVTYFDVASVVSDPNTPSTYTKMKVDYSGIEGGGLLGTTSFSTDLDDLAFDGDLSSVPLPAGFPLVIAGVIGLGLVKRRRKS